MTLISFRQNAAAVFAIILTTWSLHSFFSWHIQPLPEKLPKTIIEKLNYLKYQGEPVFLSSQLLDKLVLNHPEFNLFSAGGNTLKNAASMGNLYIIEKFQTLNCDTINKGLLTEKIDENDGFTLKKCFSDKHISVIYASSFLEKMQVSVDDHTVCEFKNGKFKTGHNGWQKIETGSAEFGEEHRFVISAHPLPDKKEIEIVIPSPDGKIKKIVLGAGIANSGKFRGSKPVIIKATQNELKKEIRTVDGEWIEKELKDFLGSEPITITIYTEKSGKRHFYFDVMYFEKDK